MNKSLLKYATTRANSMIEKDGVVDYQGLKLLVDMYADSPAESERVMCEIGMRYECHGLPHLNKCNLYRGRIHWQGLLVKHLDIVSWWCFYETSMDRNHSEEFSASKEFLKQYHPEILRLFINYAFDYTRK